MDLRELVKRARLRLALMLVEVGAKLANTSVSDEPMEAPLPMPPVTLHNTLSPAARRMVEDGRTIPRRTKKEPPKPLTGSAADLIQRRNARNAAGG